MIEDGFYLKDACFGGVFFWQESDFISNEDLSIAYERGWFWGGSKFGNF